MYRCKECGELFYEPTKYKTSYESYYGVSSDFPNSTSLELELCPCCGEDSVEEISEEDLESEEE